MVPPAVVVAAATRSASDSILRCREEERFRLQSATNPRLHRFLISGLDLGIDARFCLFMPSGVHRFLISRPDLGIDAAENSFACSSRCGSDLPHPILIFVAAKENGPPAAIVAAATFRDRFYFSLPQRRMVPPAAVVAATTFRVRF